MRIFFLSFMLLSIISSCTETIETDTRTLLTYEFDSLIDKSNYDLRVEKRSDVTIYTYSHVIDSLKNFTFRHNRNQAEIYWGPFIFYQDLSDGILREFNFRPFKTKDIIDAPNEIIFSEEFGILQFDNGMELNFEFREFEKL